MQIKQKKEGGRKKHRTSASSKSHKWELPSYTQTMTPGEAEKLLSVIHSGYTDDGKEVIQHERMSRYKEQHGRRMEDVDTIKSGLSESQTDLLELPQEDLTRLRHEMKNHGTEQDEFLHELTRTAESPSLQGSFSELQKKYELSRLYEKDLHDVNMTLLRTLHEAEVAATSAEEQLAALKDMITELADDNALSASYVSRISRQKELLLKELESFKSINRILRQKLWGLQNEEISSEQTNKDIEVLLKRLTESEVNNNHLQRKILEKENRVRELSDHYQKEKNHSYATVQLSKSIEATRAHLQGQLQSKEAENRKLAVQIQNLEGKIQEQKQETERFKHQILTSKEKAQQDKEALKKATRAQKQRAERFESAVGNLRSQIKTKEVKLTEALLAVDTWKKHHDEVADEKSSLKTQIGALNNQVTNLIEELQKTKDSARSSHEELLQKIHAVNSENGSLGLENERLKASLAALEERAISSETELKELKVQAKQQKELAEQYKTQVHDLQMEAERMKTKHEKLLKENTLITEGRELEIEKVKGQMEARLKELETFPDLSKAAEQRLQECQEKFLSCKRRCTDQSKTISELQVKVDNEHFLLDTSLKSVKALEEENSQLQTKYELLNRKLDEVSAQNRELVEKLSEQEKTLHDNESQLQERSKDVSALTRQLEAALEDIRKKVTDVKEKASSTEQVLQSKILKLEAELSRKEKELKQLRQNKNDVAKHYELRLKDLKLSLEQSESQNQSIQNYVQFLKTSYAAMFGESL